MRAFCASPKRRRVPVDFADAPRGAGVECASCSRRFRTKAFSKAGEPGGPQAAKGEAKRSAMIRAVGIISKPRREDFSRVAPQLLDWLEAHKLEVFYDQETASCIAPAAAAAASHHGSEAARFAPSAPRTA